MSKKLSKQQIIEKIMATGHDEPSASKIWDDIANIIFEVLATGGTVPILGVGKLSGEVLPAEDIKIFGEERKASERLKIKFEKSRTADNKFKNEYSTEAVKRKKLQAMAKQLRK